MMPALALIGIPGPRWLLPIPLFLLWPFVLVCQGIARLLGRDRPAEAAKLQTALQAFRGLRGLTIDVDTANHKQVRIWIV